MLDFNTAALGAFLRAEISGFEFGRRVYSYGEVSSANDDVLRVSGLRGVGFGEIVEFENDMFGLAFGLDEEGIDAVMLTRGGAVLPGSVVRGGGRIADIGVGEAAFGRVLNPAGMPLDGKPRPAARRRRPLEASAPTIIMRQPVKRPMETGILTIDSMIPIGRGQRELIVGDRQTGKTSIALSAIKKQRGNGVLCVYCAIGQKAAGIARTIAELEAAGALEYTAVIASTASDPAALRYLAPFAACAIAEEEMYAGRDVLVVYDDLSKHADAYRELSLLLGRPSGREAYPGDVFYLHSRLLERSAQLSEDCGGGSMTALPIIETLGEDISAYIPTNVISITDGQIYLSTQLRNSGLMPAVNVGLSVSRIGSAAQRRAMRKASQHLRLSVAQYRELESFAQFGASGDDSSQAALQNGRTLTELLKQDRNEIFTLAEQVAVLTAYRGGIFSGIPVSQVRACRRRLLSHLHDCCEPQLGTIDSLGVLGDDAAQELMRASKAFISGGAYGNTCGAYGNTSTE